MRWRSCGRAERPTRRPMWPTPDKVRECQRGGGRGREQGSVVTIKPDKASGQALLNKILRVVQPIAFLLRRYFALYGDSRACSVGRRPRKGQTRSNAWRQFSPCSLRALSEEQRAPGRAFSAHRLPQAEGRRVRWKPRSERALTRPHSVNAGARTGAGDEEPTDAVSQACGGSRRE